jgi:D-arabinose 1-dehydrogenase-like Zn-dependent alcohol dehydrogenase
MIGAARINEAYQRMPKRDVRYRFGIDTDSLGQPA